MASRGEKFKRRSQIPGVVRRVEVECMYDHRTLSRYARYRELDESGNILREYWALAPTKRYPGTRPLPTGLDSCTSTA